MSRFDEAYVGTPPWDIGRPQPEVERIEDAGGFRDDVVDVGCGTGENALFLAQRGHRAWGVDSAARAIEKARAKAAQRNVEVHFAVQDALRLSRLGRTFATALDCGLFHIFDDETRKRYVESLRGALAPHGRVHLLCFSDREPSDWGGPRRIARRELEDAFAEGWRIEAIVPTRFATTMPEVEGHAWRLTARRT